MGGRQDPKGCMHTQCQAHRAGPPSGTNPHGTPPSAEQGHRHMLPSSAHPSSDRWQDSPQENIPQEELQLEMEFALRNKNTKLLFFSPA